MFLFCVYALFFITSFSYPVSRLSFRLCYLRLDSPSSSCSKDIHLHEKHSTMFAAHHIASEALLSSIFVIRRLYILLLYRYIVNVIKLYQGWILNTVLFLQKSFLFHLLLFFIYLSFDYVFSIIELQSLNTVTK